MPQIVLDNVKKEDNSFKNILPKGWIHYRRLENDHPTPFIYVEYKTKAACEKAIEEVNSAPGIEYTARHCDEDKERKFRNRNSQKKSSKESIIVSPLNQSQQNMIVSNLPTCVLCKKQARLMCERCRDPYCSPDCQKNDWNAHRKICRRMPSLIPYADDKLILNMLQQTSSFNDITSPSKPTTSNDSVSEENFQVTQEQKTMMLKSPPAMVNGGEMNRGRINSAGAMSNKSNISGRVSNKGNTSGANTSGGITNRLNTSGGSVNEKTNKETINSAGGAREEGNSGRMSNGGMSARGLGSIMELTSPKKNNVPQEAAVQKISKNLNDLGRVDFPKSGSKVMIIFNVKESFNKVYIQSQETTPIMREIMAKGMDLGKTASQLCGAPESNVLYLAPYFDITTGGDHFYRVIVKNYNEETRRCQAIYVDFGNIEEIDAGLLRELPDEMMKFPRVAFRVVLQDVPLHPDSPDDLQYKEELLMTPLEIKYNGEPLKFDTPVYLTECNGGKCVNDYLNRKNLAAAVQKFKPLKFTMDSIGMKTFSCLENVEICILLDTSLDRGEVNIMTLPDLFNLTKLMERAGEVYDKISTPYTPSPNEVCMAKYAYGDDEEMWYRVQIDEKIDNDNYFVHFIDYGNFDSVASKNIREMTQEFITECCLICASIEGIEPPWSTECINKFKKVTKGGAMVAKKIQYSEDRVILSIPDIIAQL
uniref:MYND-type domain-containing protein n=1 Tax=Lutzomyia longipalpis TaxID=7200 RepID=A0A1B0CRA1_LUTLO